MVLEQILIHMVENLFLSEYLAPLRLYVVIVVISETCSKDWIKGL
jgi:hypothetical protein